MEQSRLCGKLDGGLSSSMWQWSRMQAIKVSIVYVWFHVHTSLAAWWRILYQKQLPMASDDDYSTVVVLAVVYHTLLLRVQIQAIHAMRGHSQSRSLCTALFLFELTPSSFDSNALTAADRRAAEHFSIPLDTAHTRCITSPLSWFQSNNRRRRASARLDLPCAQRGTPFQFIRY